MSRGLLNEKHTFLREKEQFFAQSIWFSERKVFGVFGGFFFMDVKIENYLSSWISSGQIVYYEWSNYFYDNLRIFSRYFRTFGEFIFQVCQNCFYMYRRILFLRRKNIYFLITFYFLQKTLTVWQQTVGGLVKTPFYLSRIKFWGKTFSRKPINFVLFFGLRRVLVMSLVLDQQLDYHTPSRWVQLLTGCFHVHLTGVLTLNHTSMHLTLPSWGEQNQ